MKHTPSPWELTSDPFEDGTPYFRFTAGSGYFDEPQNPGFHFDAIMSESDALIIVAAPELFDALTKLTKRYVALVESGDCGFWDAEKEPEVIAAFAAIAKATTGASS